MMEDQVENSELNNIRTTPTQICGYYGNSSVPTFMVKLGFWGTFNIEAVFCSSNKLNEWDKIATKIREAIIQMGFIENAEK